MRRVAVRITTDEDLNGAVRPRVQVLQATYGTHGKRGARESVRVDFEPCCARVPALARGAGEDAEAEAEAEADADADADALDAAFFSHLGIRSESATEALACPSLGAVGNAASWLASAKPTRSTRVGSFSVLGDVRIAVQNACLVRVRAADGEAPPVCAAAWLGLADSPKLALPSSASADSQTRSSAGLPWPWRTSATGFAWFRCGLAVELDPDSGLTVRALPAHIPAAHVCSVAPLD